MAFYHQVTSHYLNQCWPNLWCHMASSGHNESKLWNIENCNFYKTIEIVLPVLPLSCMYLWVIIGPANGLLSYWHQVLSWCKADVSAKIRITAGWNFMQVMCLKSQLGIPLSDGGHFRMYRIIWFRADSGFAPSQWETALLCNDVSHWLGVNLESCFISSKTSL